LKLEFSGSPAILKVREQEPPWKVVRAFANREGAALVHLNNVSGGILTGDDLELDVSVANGAEAQLTTTGATRIYRSRAGGCARQTMRAQVAGLLEYLPDAVIPFAGSRYSQRAEIDLERGAGLFYWDAIAPGREAMGELFQYDSFASETIIRAEGRPIAVERFRLQGRPWFDGFTHFASFYICRVDNHDWMALEAQLRQIATPDAHWGVSALPAHGIVVRGLAMRSRHLFTGLAAFWRVAKRAIYGKDAIPPRKLY
jgi:urease accessory protein